MYTKLKYDKYKEFLQEEEIRFGGYHWVFKFPNGYGASVIKNLCSYGSADDLFELAVIMYNEDGVYHLCYTTYITNDVIGNLNNDDVLELLERIKNYE